MIVRWRRLDVPGHERCSLSALVVGGWHLGGLAEFARDGEAIRLEYDVECDAGWETRRARVWGQVGATDVALTVVRTEQRTWFVNGARDVALDDCVDIDLGFSPSTNLIPIRRLALALDARAEVRAAWVRGLDLRVATLDQSYTRTGPATYLYESGGGRYQRELTVDANGFVVDYPGFWHAESIEPDA